ncbi:hypothetical protein WISP_124616 [Willisornis vidua]|uniref:Uncharacterized protein n=1 Tax=Willisornis vidua TaxID=1566151 RepID=A0ABQ9CXQ1_9PASS|nr:hypothetical protein WISP_124616 [Willisornis vidua]
MAKVASMPDFSYSEEEEGLITSASCDTGPESFASDKLVSIPEEIGKLRDLLELVRPRRKMRACRLPTLCDQMSNGIVSLWIPIPGGCRCPLPWSWCLVEWRWTVKTVRNIKEKPG